MRWMERTMKGILVGLIVCFCALFTTPTAQAQFDDAFIRAVDQAATGANNGESWADAYTDLQDALDDAEGDLNITEIWVAAAAEPYVPSVFFPQFFSELFFLIDGVSIYGGFLGNAPGGGETELSQRNPEMNETILSGDLNGDDDNATSSCCSIHLHEVHCQRQAVGVFVDAHDEAFHVDGVELHRVDDAHFHHPIDGDPFGAVDLAEVHEGPGRADVG